MFETVAIERRTPVTVVIAAKSAEYVVGHVCPRASDCLYEVSLNEGSIEGRARLADVSDRASVVRCEGDECDSDYFIGRGVQFTVDVLRAVF